MPPMPAPCAVDLTATVRPNPRTCSTNGRPAASRRREDIKDLFADPFYFGCEADDPLTSMAFNTAVNPFGAELNAMMGSDIAHWDVPDMAEVLEEAWEMVEHGWIDEDAFKKFTFTNPVRFYTEPIPTSSRAPWWRRPSTSFLAGRTDVLDLLLRGGTVVDGTGAPARPADVGVRDGRIVAVGRIDEDATRTVDVDGKVVCPGFIDLHTHYDAQASVGPHGQPVGPPRRHHRPRRELRVLDRPPRTRRRRLRPADDDDGGGHPPRGPPGRGAVGLDDRSPST